MWLTLAVLVVGCAPAAATKPGPSPAGPAPGAGVAPSAGAPATAAPAEGGSTAAGPAALAPLPAPLKVRMGSVGSITDGPLYVALERGYFAEAGLDVEDIRAEGATRLIAPLAAGQIEVAAAAMAAGMYNAFARDIDVRLVADKGRMLRGRGSSALVVRPDLWDAGVRSLADLRGRRVGVAGYLAGSAVTLYLGQGLEQHGLTLNDLDLVDLPLGDVNAALGNRSLEAAMHVEPLLTLGLANGFYQIVQRADEMAPDMQSSFVLYSADFATHHVEAARRWMVGYLRGVRDFHDAFEKDRDRAGVVAILTRNTGVRDPSLYDRMVSTYLDPNGRMNVAGLIEAQDWFAARGYIPQKVNVQALIDYQFVDYALGIIGEYR